MTDKLSNHPHIKAGIEAQLNTVGLSLNELLAAPAEKAEPWTYPQVEKFLQVTRRQIQRLINQGLLHPRRIGKRALRFNSNEVKALAFGKEVSA